MDETTLERSEILVGIVSDTHGLMRPEVLNALRRVDMILHAGDIGKPEVLDKLKALAPVKAIRGNVDRAEWCRRLPKTEAVEIGEITAYLIHDVTQLDVDPVAAGIQLVISGHSHRPSISERDGVMYLNPGSAGPRRFRLPCTIAHLRVIGQKLEAQIIDMEID